MIFFSKHWYDIGGGLALLVLSWLALGNTLPTYNYLLWLSLVSLFEGRERAITLASGKDVCACAIPKTAPWGMELDGNVANDPGRSCGFQTHVDPQGIRQAILREGVRPDADR